MGFIPKFFKQEELTQESEKPTEGTTSLSPEIAESKDAAEGSLSLLDRNLNARGNENLLI
jgi:hypothetical protein